MKSVKALRKLSALAFVCLLVVVSCSKDDSSGGESNKPLTEFEFAGIFTGTLNSNGQTTELMGYVAIDDDGDTTLDLLSGRMKGNSVKVGDNYNITITEGSGFFANVEDITGSIDTTSRVIYLSGTNPDGSQMTVGGNAQNPALVNDGGWGNLQKSSVVFTHLEDCVASVTVNGVTFSGLEIFYQNETLCQDYYFRQLRFNLDDKTSGIACNTYTLLGLDGEYHTYTDCTSVRFILDKNTEYDYTVVWDNGEVTTGTFTSPDGGYQLPICLTQDGPACDGSGGGGMQGESGNPRFNLQFTNSANVDLDLYVQTPNGSIIYYGNSTGQGGEHDVDCACGDNCNQENIFWEGNGPSGQYKFWVEYYGGCGGGTPSSNFTIKVMNNNTVVMTKTGTLSSGESTRWTYNHN